MRGLPAILALVALTLAAASAARAQGDSRAGLVVQFGDGSVQTACVRFPEQEISGVELLGRSGLPVIVQSGGLGAAVCKIGPDGCNYPAEGCFCKRDGARSIYWAFYTLDGGVWAFSNLGAANTPVRDGSVHGWAWGLGDSGGGAQPPVLGIEAVCGAAQAPPTAAPAPTAPPPPTDPAVATAAPSVPAAASATAEPSATAAPPLPTDPAVATAAPSATAAASATAEPSATAAPSVPAAATATPPGPAAGGAQAPPTDAGGPPQGGLIGFAALALILAAGVALAARRR